MYAEPLSVGVKKRLGVASQALRTANPTSFMQRLLDETFSLPAGHPAYAQNALTPGSAPLELRWSDGNGSQARLRSRSLSLAANGAALKELRALLGDEQVRLVRGG